MRERLIELLKGAETKVTEMLSSPLALEEWLAVYADHLLANGVIVPPCKVGDRVYCLKRVVWDDECCHCDHYRIGGFGDPSECGRTEDGMKHPDCIKITEEVLTQDDIYHYLRFHAFGEYIFPSRAEAEQALEDMRKE